MAMGGCRFFQQLQCILTAMQSWRKAGVEDTATSSSSSPSKTWSGGLRCQLGIPRRWLLADANFDDAIANNMTYSRWRQIKSVFKLNNNITSPGRGKEGYNPAAKYDLMYCTICMNHFTLWAELDAALDESTWGFGGYMEDCGGRLINKPGGKGGQTTMKFDVSRCYPRAYVHQHKIHERQDGFTAEGKFEIKHLIDQIEKLVVGGGATDDELNVSIPPPSGSGTPAFYWKRQIYSRPPHLTCDIHFSGDNVLDYAGSKGFGITQTCRRDRFPDGLKNYLHHEVVNANDARPKAMRFQKPIVAIKQVPTRGDGEATTKPYTKTMVSFQSTGATDICSVNNLPSADLYVTVKARGKGPARRVWGIEQNEARATYLRHYYGVDNVDHMIKMQRF